MNDQWDDEDEWDDEDDWDDDDDYDDDDYIEGGHWSTFNQGFRIRNDDPDAAVSLMLQGRDAAVEADDLRGAFYMNHWILQTLLYTKRDYVASLELAVKAAAESGKPLYEGMQERICIMKDLTQAYFGIDPPGYAHLVDQAIQEMDRRISGPVNCRFCMQGMRCSLAIRQGDLEVAEQFANQYLSMCEDRGDFRHYGIWALEYLTEIPYLRGEWARAREFATRGADYARKSSTMFVSVPVFEAYLAAIARKLGNEDAAGQHYRLATTQAKKDDPHGESYYDRLCDYHEAGGNLQAALDIRERELRMINGRGQIYREASVLLHKARLLKQMRQPFAEPLAAAEALIPRLKRPEVLADQVNALKA